MIRYCGQLKTAKFNYKYATKRGQRVKKCLDIFTFDIEVTSAWMYHDKLIAYEAGHDAEFWNSLKKYALPYVWQFSFNDTVYYGRELQEFKDLLSDMPDDLNCIIYIHNLAYEYQFLLNIMEVQDVFARAPHKPMKCSFKEFPLLEFRCSYILTNLSLEQWGDQLKLPKLVGELEYNYMRTPNTPLFDYELDYCERDCEVVYRGILEHLKTYKSVWDIPLTSTGKVRRKVKKKVTNDYEYMREVKRTIPKDDAEYKLLQKVFAGGYTHANRKYLDDVIKGKIHHVDIASSYPFVLTAFKYPYNKWCYIGNILPDVKTFEDRAYIIRLHFIGLRCIAWNTYIAVAKSRGSGFLYDNGRILAADELWYTCTEADYLTVIHNYEWDKMICEGVFCCQKRYLPKIFIEEVLAYYKDKTMLKGVDPVRYAISKQYINSLAGMCETALFQTEVLFDQDAQEQWDVEPLDPEKVNEGLDKLRKWFNKKYFVSYSVGCWLTAYARRRLWECIESCDSDLLYTDTDSLFYIGEHDFSWFNEEAGERLKAMCEYHGIDYDDTRPPDPDGVIHPLGVLEPEDDCVEFRTLGAKKYIEKRIVTDKETGKKSKKLFMTISGVNKGAVECLKGDINNFKDGFEFDKDHPSVHKLEHTYLTDMQPVMWPGGYYSDFKYGINMRPTGYKLSKPNVYKSAIEVMESGNVIFSEYFLSKARGYFRR